MIKTYSYATLGQADHGWLQARHHFSFADYHNPERMRFGTLRVINDDIIKAGAGFDIHPHRNMEIITYVRQGAITHKDSKGNEGRTKAGDVQVMSAGKGIFHSEFNLENEDTKLFQIWIEPNQQDIEPKWGTHHFPKEASQTGLNLLVSGDGKAPLTIQQNAYMYAGHLEAGTVIHHPIKHQAYLLMSEGKIEIDGNILQKGDGAEIYDVSSVEITVVKAAEMIILDIPGR